MDRFTPCWLNMFKPPFYASSLGFSTHFGYVYSFLCDRRPYVAEPRARTFTLEDFKGRRWVVSRSGPVDALITESGISQANIVLKLSSPQKIGIYLIHDGWLMIQEYTTIIWGLLYGSYPCNHQPIPFSTNRYFMAWQRPLNPPIIKFLGWKILRSQMMFPFFPSYQPPLSWYFPSHVDTGGYMINSAGGHIQISIHQAFL